MKVSEATAEKMQLLLQKFFDANAVSDNIAYWLGYHYYNNIEKAYHMKWAHAFPSDIFADGLSGFMLKSDIRPVRLGLADHTQDFNDLVEVFETNRQLAEELESSIKELIDTAEMSEDTEVKLFAEELSLTILNYLKQAKEWEYVAKTVSPAEMNIHFDLYTNFI